MGKKKGFTLIELIAVIVILALVALIAVPTIMNIINEVQKNAFMDSIYGIIKSGDLYYSIKDMMGEELEDTTFEFPNNIEGLELDGNVSGTGQMKVYKDGEIILALSNGKYCVKKIIDRNELVVDENIENCILPVTLQEVATTSEELGIASIDNCMLNGICQPGTAFAIKVNDAEIKKFYVTEDNGEEITLIMSENTSEKIAWYSSGGNSKGPLTALEVLKNDTDGWINIPQRTYIIEDDGGYSQYQPISIKMRTRLFTVTEAKKLGCVYEKSNLCPSFFSGSYWLSSADAVYYGALTIRGRTLRSYMANYNYYDGTRPVITLIANRKNTSLVDDIELETNEVVTIPNVGFTVKTTVIPNEANNKELKWSSSDSAVAKVDENGLVTGVSAGNATIYVESTDGTNIKKEINITVNQVKTLSEIATTSETLEVTEVNSCATSGTCEPGTSFAIKVNDTETYKFYVVSDNEKEVTLIMNQNIGSNTIWKEKESIEGPVTVFKLLQKQTSDWDNISLRPYVLSDEYRNYLNVNFYNMRARILNQTEAMALGCEYQVADTCPSFLTENTNSYWLSTSDGGINNARIIASTMGWAYATFQKHGVRPVIVVPKN